MDERLWENCIRYSKFIFEHIKWGLKKQYMVDLKILEQLSQKRLSSPTHGHLQFAQISRSTYSNMGYKKAASISLPGCFFCGLRGRRSSGFSVSQLLLWSIVINPAAKTVPLWPNQWATKKSKYVVAVEVKWEGNADLLCIQRINIHTQLECLWVAEHWKERERAKMGDRQVFFLINTTTRQIVGPKHSDSWKCTT